MASDKDMPIYLTQQFLARDYHREFVWILCYVWTNTEHCASVHPPSSKNKEGECLQRFTMLHISYFHIRFCTERLLYLKRFLRLWL